MPLRRIRRSPGLAGYARAHILIRQRGRPMVCAVSEDWSAIGHTHRGIARWPPGTFCPHATLAVSALRAVPVPAVIESCHTHHRWVQRMKMSLLPRCGPFRTAPVSMREASGCLAGLAPQLRDVEVTNLIEHLQVGRARIVRVGPFPSMESPMPIVQSDLGVDTLSEIDAMRMILRRSQH